MRFYMCRADNLVVVFLGQSSLVIVTEEDLQTAQQLIDAWVQDAKVARWRLLRQAASEVFMELIRQDFKPRDLGQQRTVSFTPLCECIQHRIQLFEALACRRLSAKV